MPPRVSHKLNSFQKTALAWDRLYPYNAAHAVRIAGAPDIPRLERSLHRCLEHYGLGAFRLDEKGRGFRFEKSGCVPALERLPRSGNVQEDIRKHLETELNRRFPLDRAASPFRFFLAEEENGFYLCLVYFHVVADGSSIVYLLNDIVRDYDDHPAKGAGRIYPRVQHNPVFLLSRFFGWVGALRADIADVRRTRRILPKPELPKRTGLLMGRLEANGTALAEKSRTWGVTLNDVFLAALLQAVAPLQTAKNPAKRRRVAVSSIVSTRRDVGLNGGREFGLFLSSFRVSAASPEKNTLREMAADVHRQTQRAKRDRLHQRNVFETTLALWLERFCAPGPQRERFYAKHYPLAAGLTNIDLRPLWGSDSPERPDYWRAVSTSAAVPMVFSVTTAGKNLNVSVGYSTHVYTEEEAHRALRYFLGLMREFASI